MRKGNNEISKNLLVDLYNSGLSMGEIADKLNKSPSTIVYYFRKHKIPRRSRSEATYVKQNPGGDPFRIKRKLTKKEAELKGMGLGLFWGEGCRRNFKGVRLGNTDPKLIKKFIEFLQKICGVKKEKLRFQLQVFSDINPQKALKFWIKQLDISPKQFTRTITISLSRKRGTYKKKSKYGVLMVGCYNTKLKNAIENMLG